MTTDPNDTSMTDDAARKPEVAEISVPTIKPVLPVAAPAKVAEADAPPVVATVAVPEPVVATAPTIAAPTVELGEPVAPVVAVPQPVSVEPEPAATAVVAPVVEAPVVEAPLVQVASVEHVVSEPAVEAPVAPVVGKRADAGEPLFTIEVWQLGVIVLGLLLVVAHFVAGTPLPAPSGLAQVSLAIKIVPALLLLLLLVLLKRRQQAA